MSVTVYLANSYKRLARDVKSFGHTESRLPRREVVRTVLRKIALSPSNRRRTDAADQTRSRAGSGHLCFGDRFTRRAVRNGGRIY